MAKGIGRDYLFAQYLDASNLNARAQLPQRYSTNPKGWQGAQQLEPWFSQVVLRRQENSLRVTEAAPLVAYVASTQTLSEEALRTLAAHVEAEIAQHGAIQITKDSGLFIAVRD